MGRPNCLFMGTTNKSLYYLNARCRHLPFFAKKQLVIQLIFPHFDYVSVAFLDLHKDRSQRLDKQLNKAISFILSLPRRHDSEKYRKKLHWLPLAVRRKFFLLIQTFKVLKRKKLEYLFSLLDPHFNTPNSDYLYHTRNAPTFQIPLSRKPFDSSFPTATMEAWNHLPPEVQRIDELSCFRPKVEKLLFE